MANREYSAEEIKELFQALYAEKKRVLLLEESSKEAEENLIKLKQMISTAQQKPEDFISRSTFEGLQKDKEILEEDLIESSHTIGLLQQELALINKKFDLDKNEEVALLQQQIIKMHSKNREWEGLLEESRLHAGQLEKGIEYLRAKLSESKTDRALLQEQLTQSLEQIRREEEKSGKEREENALKHQEKMREIDFLWERSNSFEADAQTSKKESEELLGTLSDKENLLQQQQEELAILNKLFEESTAASRKESEELLGTISDKENVIQQQQEELAILNKLFEESTAASRKESEGLLGKLSNKENVIQQQQEELTILNKLFEESAAASRKESEGLLEKLSDKENVIQQQQEELTILNKLFEESTAASRNETEGLLGKLSDKENLLQQQQEELTILNKLFEESTAASRNETEGLLEKLSDKENLLQLQQEELVILNKLFEESTAASRKDSEGLLERLSDKENVIQQLQEELERYKQTECDLKEEISKHLINKEDFQRNLEEKEKAKAKVIECEMRLQDSQNQIIIAQQHLAKRLKEFTFLQEEFEVEKGRKIEMERKLNAFRTQLRELESNLETSRRREREVEDMRRSQETYRKECEKKIAELAENINRQQQHIHLLESIEKKYNQLSQFFQASAPPTNLAPSTPETSSLKIEEPSTPIEEKIFKEDPPVSDQPLPASKPQNYNYQFFDRE